MFRLLRYIKIICKLLRDMHIRIYIYIHTFGEKEKMVDGYIYYIHIYDSGKKN